MVAGLQSRIGRLREGFSALLESRPRFFGDTALELVTVPTEHSPLSQL